MKKRLSNKMSGFMLVEATLSWVLLSIICLTFAMLISTGISSYSLISSRKEALSNARYALSRMTQEFLLLKPADILSISTNTFSFLDAAGTNTDFHSQSSNGSSALYRGTDLLAQDLSSFSFSYYDANGVLMTDYSNPALMRRIKIDMTVKADNNPGDLAVSTEIFPKNFYYSNFQ